MTRSLVHASLLFAWTVILLQLPTIGRAQESAQQARKVEVVAKDGSFEPSKIAAQPGEVLHVTVINQGSLPHSIRFILPSGEVGIDETIAAGSSGSMDLTVPSKEGQFVFYCPVDNHRAMGMEGKLVVQKAE